jgi:hypothetical protein
MIIGMKKDVTWDVENPHFPTSIESKHETGMINLPTGVESKGELIESIPLFLSDHYKSIYLASAQVNKYASGPTSPKSGSVAAKKELEKKDVKKGAAKIYRS